MACGQHRDVHTLFVGNYADGIYAYDFDLANGEIIPGEGEYGSFAKAPMPNPSYMTIFGNHLWAVSEMPDETASVYAWRFDGGGFTFLNKQPTGLPQNGEDPCYVATNGMGLLAVANYSGGSLAVYRLKDDGSIMPMDTLILSGIGGPDMTRQDKPHVHCARFLADGEHLIFSEFSSDAVGVLDINGHTVSNYRTAVQLPEDFGPRHIITADGRAFVIGELSGDVAVLNPTTKGRFEIKQIIKADQVDARGAADIHFSPDGEFLYASLRLQNDGIAIFQVADNGTLTPAGYQLTGPHPRNFCVTDDEVLVACRDNDSIEFYSRDKKTGLLSDTGRRLEVSKPVFVAVR
jgi:6-phosphogluconolactonase (cycloisomerase 2 family)